MAAPIGNQYYKKRGKDGRELIYGSPDKLLSEAYNYFEWCDENPWIKKDFIKSGDLAGNIVDIPTSRPYTIEGLCVYIGISVQTFSNYGGREDFIGVVTHIRDIIHQNQLEGACVGAYNSNIIARVLGLADKKELTGQDGKDLTINITPKATKEELHKAEETKNNLEALKEQLGGS